MPDGMSSWPMKMSGASGSSAASSPFARVDGLDGGLLALLVECVELERALACPCLVRLHQQV